MTSRYDRKTNVLTFDCDQPGCHRNFETESGSFKDGWREAQSEGWAYVPHYPDGVSEARHFCPEHAKQFG